FARRGGDGAAALLALDCVGAHHRPPDRQLRQAPPNSSAPTNPNNTSSDATTTKAILAVLRGTLPITSPVWPLTSSRSAPLSVLKAAIHTGSNTSRTASTVTSVLDWSDWYLSPGSRSLAITRFSRAASSLRATSSACWCAMVGCS